MSASPAIDGREQLRDLGGVVLAVAVEADRELVAVLERVPEAGLHGAADAEVEREAEHDGAPRLCDRRRAVRRAVVDDDDVEAGIEGPDLVDDAADRAAPR